MMKDAESAHLVLNWGATEPSLRVTPEAHGVLYF